MRFGGDPGSVTIFGQSGGGGKTAILNGMPAAKGLFHRAIIQSTLWDTAITALEVPDATRATEMFLSRLGVKAGEIGRLQAMPPEQLIEALPLLARHLDEVCASQGWTNADDAPVRAVGVGVVSVGADDVRLERNRERPVREPDDPFWKSEIADEGALRDRVRRAIRIDDAGADRLIALYRAHRPGHARRPRARHRVGQQPAAPVRARHR